MIHHIYCLVRVSCVATPIRLTRKCKIEPLVIINISSCINPQRMLNVSMCVCGCVLPDVSECHPSPVLEGKAVQGFYKWSGVASHIHVQLNQYICVLVFSSSGRPSECRVNKPRLKNKCCHFTFQMCLPLLYISANHGYFGYSLVRFGHNNRLK